MEIERELPTIAHSFEQEAWEFSRLRLGNVRWLTASKQFESAGGARTAVLYMRRTEEGGLCVSGTYESAGEDVLAGHLLVLSAEKAGEVTSLLPAYLQEVTRRIENSWGRRVLRARAAA